MKSNNSIINTGLKYGFISSIFAIIEIMLMYNSGIYVNLIRTTAFLFHTSFIPLFAGFKFSNHNDYRAGTLFGEGMGIEFVASIISSGLGLIPYLLTTILLNNANTPYYRTKTITTNVLLDNELTLFVLLSLLLGYSLAMSVRILVATIMGGIGSILKSVLVK